MPIVSGADTTVNRSRPNNQFDVTVTALADGGWVVTWRSNGMTGSNASLHQQVFNANGSFRSAEGTISGASTDNFDQTVTPLKDGGWIVTWAETNASTGSDIHQRVFNANGTARGQDKIISVYGYGSSYKHTAPHVTLLDGGNQVVTWQQYDTGYGDNWQVRNLWDSYYLVNDSKGARIFNENRVGNYNQGHSYDVETVALKNGGFVAIWVAEGRGASQTNHYTAAYGADIYQKFYLASGVETNVFLQSNGLINSTISGNQRNPEIAALSNGGWVVTWVSEGQDGSGTGVYQQVYNSGGVAVRGETRVNSVTAGNQHKQTVTELAKGGWVVTWVSEGQDGSGAGIYQKTFNADGTARSAETRVNTYRPGDQHDQKVTALTDGGWVVVWTSLSKSGSGRDIHQQVYKPNGSAFGGEIVIRSKGAGYNENAEVTALKNGGWVVTWEALDSDGLGGNDRNIHQKVFSNTSAPVITSGQGAASATVRLAENKTAVTVLKATDAEKKALTWSLSGGEDKARFAIDAKTGVLTFKARPDFEAPADKNKDNVYKVVVKVTDPDQFADTQVLSIVVRDIKGKTLTGNAKANKLVGAAENDVLKGGGGDDKLYGKADADKLYGGAGNDYLSGGTGNDRLFGGSGNDTAWGHSGNDRLYGDAGNDKLFGNGGKDQIRGGDGDDQIAGGSGNDTLYGEDGKDILIDEGGNDLLDGGKGDDGLRGGDGNDTLRGQAGNDLMFGDAGNDKLYGGSGKDYLIGGRGADALYGGSGRDSFVLDTPRSKRGTASEIDTIYDFERGVDKIDISTVKWISDTEGLSFRKISMHIPSADGVTITSGVRVFHDGFALVDVYVNALSAGDFII